MMDFFTQIAIEDGWFRYSSVEFKLRSGRKFRYQMEDYPFRVDASEAEIDALVCHIIRDKYRYCEWDRAHPHTNTEVEIFDAIKEWMLHEVAEAQRLRADPDAPIQRFNGKPRVFAYWAIFSGNDVVEEFPFRDRAEAERRLEELLNREPGQYVLRQMKRTEVPEKDAEQSAAADRPRE